MSRIRWIVIYTFHDINSCAFLANHHSRKHCHTVCKQFLSVMIGLRNGGPDTRRFCEWFQWRRKSQELICPSQELIFSSQELIFAKSDYSEVSGPHIRTIHQEGAPRFWDSDELQEETLHGNQAMIDHDNCIFEDKYSTNISLDIFKKVLVPGLSHNGSHADIQYIIYTGNQKFCNWLMGPVFHREYCHSYPHHLCLNLRLYFLGLLHALSLCDVSGCVWHQTSCHILHILHLSGRSCAFQVVLGLGNRLALLNISQQCICTVHG